MITNARLARNVGELLATVGVWVLADELEGRVPEPMSHGELALGYRVEKLVLHLSQPVATVTQRWTKRCQPERCWWIQEFSLGP